MSITTTFANYLSELATKIVIYYLIPIYIIGIIGNLINIIIFLRRSLRRNACSLYFVGMSSAEIILFNTLCLTKIITYTTNYDLAQTVIILCKIRLYLFVIGLGLLRQFLCLISIDRWIISNKDTNIRKYSSLYIVRWLIIGSIIFWILYSSHVFITFQGSPIRPCAAPSGDNNYALFYGIQNTVSTILPFIIMIIFSICTWRNFRSYRRIQVIRSNIPVSVVPIILPRSINYRQHEIQLIKISLLQVIFYIFLNMIGTSYPLYSILTRLQEKNFDQIFIDIFLADVGLFLLYTYSAITFILYTLASKTFRKEFILTLFQLFKYIQHRFSNY